MKNWTNADLVELNVSETAEGGSNIQKVDKYWKDQDGNQWSSYASGGVATGDDIVVSKP